MRATESRQDNAVPLSPTGDVPGTNRMERAHAARPSSRRTSTADRLWPEITGLLREHHQELQGVSHDPALLEETVQAPRETARIQPPRQL